MRHARVSRAGGWLLGLLGLVPGLALAASCPVDQSGYTPSDWPTSKTPSDDTWTVTGLTSAKFRCGLDLGLDSYLSQSGVSLSAGLSAIHEMLSTPNSSSYPTNAFHTQCVTERSSGVYAITVIYKHFGLNPGSFKYKAAEVYNGVSDESCTPVEPEAVCAAGKTSLVGNRGVTFESAMGESPRCVGECKVEITATGPGMDKECNDGVCTWDWLGLAKTTGEACQSGSSPAPNPVPDTPEEMEPFEQYAEDENCVLSDRGVEYCMSFDPLRSEENCGYVNDNFVCLEKIKQDNCWAMPDGSRLCAEGAKPPAAPTAPPPAPKSQTATPDDQIKGSTTNNTYNYYNSTTVVNSQRPVTQDGSNPVTGTPGAGTGGGGDGEEEGGGSASGGQTCEAPPACEGDPIQCAVLEQQWRSRCVDTYTDEELEGIYGPTSNEEGDLFGTTEHTLPSALNADGWLTGGECLEDLTINLGQLLGSIEIPFSELCWLINAIGFFVMITSYVGAAKILVGGL